MSKPLFRYFDNRITDILLEHIPKNVHFEFQDSFVQALSDNEKLEVQLFTGKKFQVDTCVYAINPKPDSALVKDVVELEFDSSILVDEYMQTTDPSIYAIGDLVRIPFGTIAERAYLPLIANARRTAYTAVHNILFPTLRAIQPSQRTIGTELFGFFLGSTGLTKSECDFYDLEVTEISKTYDSFSKYHLPRDFTLTIKIIFENNSRRLVGAQLITNRENILEWINILSEMIIGNRRIDDLTFSDIFYNPQLSPSINFLADIALEAINY